MSKDLLITKASGDIVPFQKEKLRLSLLKAGADTNVAESIVEEVESHLFEGISTRKIYQQAHGLLKKRSKKLAGKYRIKQAIMELGPTGYPFEKFVALILKHQGFQVSTGQIVEGHCVTHEIDVVAEKGDHHYMVECKYHNQPGISCDVKIPLYIQSRFKDVEAQWKLIPGHGTKFHQGWLVTNTKFTGDAIKYGTCIGLNLIGWNFPEKNSLRYLIEKLGLYPVTCMNSLTKAEKVLLVENNILLCSEIRSNERVLKGIGISTARFNVIKSEADAIAE